ncbi:UPF0041 domain protein [Rhizodiscina lignyota]|uniref:Mitochondrial pyruvate carrier n=1 Tax=Rhizodiscina lignyota TaxID=1504668 RepID=A0A9P4IC27_9PEZI|nr:UPF0041 domain protein [Rhizodiscina lignyota]
MSARPALRFFTAARTGAAPTFRSSIRTPFQRRVQTAAETNVEPPSPQSGFSKFFNSPVGPKTVHFWAPIMKWGLVLAGVADFARPAESLSLTQNMALMATGAIWTRWCFIIKPRNLFLAAVNFFLFCVGSTQVTRILMYQQSLKGDSMGSEVKKAATEQAQVVEEAVKDPKGALEKAKVN